MTLKNKIGTPKNLTEMRQMALNDLKFGNKKCNKYNLNIIYIYIYNNIH